MTSRRGSLFITVIATLGVLFVFLGLVWLAAHKENPLAEPKPDNGRREGRAEGGPRRQARRGEGAERGGTRRASGRRCRVTRRTGSCSPRSRGRTTRCRSPRRSRRCRASQRKTIRKTTRGRTHDRLECRASCAAAGGGERNCSPSADQCRRYRAVRERHRLDRAVRRRGGAGARLGVQERPVRELRPRVEVDLRPGRADRRTDRRVPRREPAEMAGIGPQDAIDRALEEVLSAPFRAD